MQKEVLTIEKIKQDYKIHFLKSFKEFAVSFVLITLLIAFIIYMCSFLDSFTFLYKAILIAPLIFFDGIIVYALCDIFVKRHLFNDNKFHIVTDKLISSEEKEEYRANLFLALSSKPYTLHFAQYGDYYIPTKYNHSFSPMFNMDGVSVYNYAKEGDVFYLVTCNKKKEIIFAYNTRLFDFEYLKTTK